MITELASALVGFALGVTAGAMLLDAYHERQNRALQAAADAARQLITVRQELARSEALLDALNAELAHQKATSRRMESIYSERVRSLMETPKAWN